METRSYAWSTICAWGLTISVAVLGVAGVVAMFGAGGRQFETACVIAFASMAAFAIAGANNAAAAALHALSCRPVHRATLVPAFICAGGFAVASNVGVHLGWAILAASAAHPEQLPDAWVVDAAALFLCFAKPAMSWVIEGRKAMDRDEKIANEAKLAEELAAIRAKDQTGAARPPRGSRPKLVEVAAMGLALAAPLVGPSAAAEPPRTEPVTRSLSQSEAQDQEPARVQARLLLRQGQFPTAVHRETSVPLSTLKRWSREMRLHDRP